MVVYLLEGQENKKLPMVVLELMFKWVGRVYVEKAELKNPIFQLGYCLLETMHRNIPFEILYWVLRKFLWKSMFMSLCKCVHTKNGHSSK